VVCLSVVCLSVVCHIRALCSNRSTDLSAIWQVHLWGLMTDCVRWVLDPSGRGDLECRTPSQSAKPSVLCCHLNINEELRGFATAIPHLPNFFGPQFSSLLYTPKLPINRFPLLVHNASLHYVSRFGLPYLTLPYLRGELCTQR